MCAQVSQSERCLKECAALQSVLLRAAVLADQQLAGVLLLALCGTVTTPLFAAVEVSSRSMKGLDQSRSRFSKAKLKKF